MIQCRRVLVPVTTCTCLLLVAGHLDAATVRLVAVAVNDQRFDDDPQSLVDALPGDRIEAEILVSGWGTEIDPVQFAQVTVDNEELISKPGTSTCGAIYPLHAGEPSPGDGLREGAFICAPPDCGYCSDESANAGTRCYLQGADCSLGTCAGGVEAGAACDLDADCSGGTCETGTCINEICNGGRNAGEPCLEVDNPCDVGTCEPRDDFLLVGGSLIISAVETFQVFPDYRFGGVVIPDGGRVDPSHCVGGTHDAEPCEGDEDCPDGACDLVEFYFGTVILEVGQDAIGVFNYSPLPSPASFIGGPNYSVATIHVEPLVIEVDPGVVCDDLRGACCFALGWCEDVSPSVCESQGGVFAGTG